MTSLVIKLLSTVLSGLCHDICFRVSRSPWLTRFSLLHPALLWTHYEEGVLRKEVLAEVDAKAVMITPQMLTLPFPFLVDRLDL